MNKKTFFCAEFMKKALAKLSIFYIVTGSLFISACSQQRVVTQNSSSAHTHSKHSNIQHSPHQPKLSQSAQSSAVDPHFEARNRMINIASSVLGTPYKWGGNNPRTGFDCSGLTRYVHKNALGINIPRTTAKQRDTSRTINYSELKPGDMLFFKTGRKTNHVGIYIGDRKFIHAPSSGKRVSIASMDSAYWHKRFVKFGTYL